MHIHIYIYIYIYIYLCAPCRVVERLSALRRVRPRRVT